MTIKDITFYEWNKRWFLKRHNSVYNTKVFDPAITIIKDLKNIAKQVIKLRLDHKAGYIDNTDKILQHLPKTV